MPGDFAKARSSQVPEGFIAVPVSSGQELAPLKVCVLVRKQPDKAGGYFNILRETVDALVLLGCVIDAATRARQWVEVWVQNTDSLRNAVATVRESISNASLDERWRRQAVALDVTMPNSLIVTGWEQTNPLPTFIDLATARPVYPMDLESGQPLELCRDEGVLAAAGLPAYGSTVHRYLHVRDKPSSPLVPVTTDAPMNDRTRPLAEMLGERQLIPLNPGGALMLVREAALLKYEAFVDFCAGAPLEESLLAGGEVAGVGLPEEDEATDALQSGGWLFLGSHGRWGRLLEGFHLKLCAMTETIRSVREMVRQTQSPMLNVTADSFRVRFGESACGLPWLWTVRVALVTPGDVIELPIKTSETKHYLAGRDAGMSVYRPPTVGRSSRGRATVRIRKVLVEPSNAGGPVVLEGTLGTQDILEVGSHDLVWLRLRVGDRRVDFYAHLEAQAALTAGEWRFRTVEQRFDQQIAANIKATEGLAFPDVIYDVLPSLNTPCDLHALAVLAVRTLLVNGRRTLPVALDELQSLARQVAADARTAQQGDATASLPPLPQRVAAIFNKDSRWLQSLGPQHLGYEPIRDEDAFDLVPTSLWWETLAALIRMLPAVGPDSECADYGEGRSGGLHRVFDRALADFGLLSLRSRSLIIIDWHYNREIDAVLRSQVTGGPAVAASPPRATGIAPVQPVQSNQPPQPSPSAPGSRATPGQKPPIPVRRDSPVGRPVDRK